MDADAKLDTAVCRNVAASVSDLLLDLDRAAQRIDDAGELDEEAIAGSFDQPTAMCGDRRINHFRSDRPQPTKRSFLVKPDQAGIAGDIGCQDRGEPPGCGQFSGTPALRRPSRRRSVTSPAGGRFSFIQVRENSGRTRSNLARASAAASLSPCIPAAAVMLR